MSTSEKKWRVRNGYAAHGVPGHRSKDPVLGGETFEATEEQVASIRHVLEDVTDGYELPKRKRRGNRGTDKQAVPASTK